VLIVSDNIGNALNKLKAEVCHILDILRVILRCRLCYVAYV